MKTPETKKQFNKEEFSILVKQFKDAKDATAGNWRLPLLFYLSFGKKRTCEIKRDIDELNERTLARVLIDLGAYGLISRTVINGDATNVEYSILPAGELFLNLFLATARTGKDYRDHLYGGKK